MSVDLSTEMVEAHGLGRHLSPDSYFRQVCPLCREADEVIDAIGDLYTGCVEREEDERAERVDDKMFLLALGRRFDAE